MKLKKHDKKARRRAGFSLSETLLAVLLLAIIFLAATVGVRALYNAYQKITVQAEAQVLLSTAVSEITNDIHGVTQVKNTGSGYQYYTTARNTFIYYDNATADEAFKGITVISGVSGNKAALLPDAAFTKSSSISLIHFDLYIKQPFSKCKYKLL